MPHARHSFSLVRRVFFAFPLAILALLALLLVTSSSSAQPAALDHASVSSAATATIVNTHVTTDTTWTLAGSPYQVTTDIQVYQGATLTVEPGVVVQFAQSTMLDVRGKILASGTPTQTILFTGSSQQPGWWDGISIQGIAGTPNQGSVLEFVTVEYGGSVYGNLYFFSAQARVRHSLFRNSLKDGIYGLAAAAIELENTTFTDNAGYAIHLNNASVDPFFAGLSASGNGHDAILMDFANLVGENHWENAGLPYRVNSVVTLATNGLLTIDPGVEVGFAPDATLDIRGRLVAAGTEQEPILLTGVVKTPGTWKGITIQGSSIAPNSGSVLDYVTIEFGGKSEANLRLLFASASVSHAVIRLSGNDGVRADIGAANTVIESSQIVDNGGFGVQYSALDGNALIAAGNWWGSATGPSVAQNCNPGGTGESVSPNVQFRPFLTGADEVLSTVAPLDLLQIAIAPQRWYVPADGVTQAEVILTLRSGEGNPVAGEAITLRSTHGTVITGGITNAHGETRARVSANTAGEAVLSASIAFNQLCSSNYRSATSTIRFTQFTSPDLLPNAAAPYMDDGLTFNPEPVVLNVPTQVSANLTNPNDFAIFVNGTFGIAQSGIGLQFPPVGSVENIEIPANGTRKVFANWTPPISGHYCIKFTYNWTTIPANDTARGALPVEVSQSKSSQKNLNIYGGSASSPSSKDSLAKAKTSMNAVNQITGVDSDIFDLDLPGKMVDAMTDMMFEKAAQISQALGFDPPRQDYTLIAEAAPADLVPLAADPKRSPQMVAALIDLREAMRWATAYGAAAIVAYDRYGGASAANDMAWSSLQINAYNENRSKFAQFLIEAAEALDAYRAAWTAHGLPDYTVTGAQLRAYQQELMVGGMSAEEIAAAQALGYTAEEIEAIRQRRLAADPDAPMPSALGSMELLSQRFMDVARTILYPPNFGFSVGGSAGLLAAGSTPIDPPPTVPASNNLARFYDAVSTIQIGNPKASQATIDLRVLPIDMPAGWTASVTPTQVILDAGEQIAVEVRMTPHGPTVQGISPRVAVEAYIGSELLGGVTVQVVVPYNVDKADSHLTTFLPIVDQ